MAVDFNPQIQELGNRDWSGASRGTGPNRSFEALFEGLAETGRNVIINRDAQTQENIETEAREIFEQTNTEFGFDPPPAGMQGELDRIVALQNALEQGKISQVNYYGRLATLSKQLRSKYPRYEGIVDSTIQSVTGTRPANAYRDALLSEFDSLSQSASDEAKFRRQYEKDNEGAIAAIFGEEYFQDPSSYDFDQVRSKVAGFKGEMETIDAEMKRLQRNAKLGEVNTEQAKTNANRNASFAVTSALDRVANGQGFDQMISDFISSGGEGLDEFQVSITQTEAQIRTDLSTMLQREYVANGLLSQADANQIVEDALYPILSAKEQILGGNFEFAGRIAKINKDVADRGLQEIYRKYPNAKIGAGISEFNPYAGAEWMARNGVLDQIGNIAVETAGQAAGGNAPEIIKDTVQSGDAKTAIRTIDTVLEVLKQPNVTPDHVRNLTEQLFGDGAIDLMDPNVVAAEDLEQIYTRLLDPAITESIVRTGDPELLEKYTDWAFEKFRAIPNVRRIAGDISSGLSGLNPEDIEVEYNPSSNRLEFRVLNEEALESRPGSFNITTPLLPSFIGAFNRSLAVLDPIVQAQGGDMSQTVKDMIGEMSRLEEGGRSDGFFKWLGDKLSMESTGSGQEIAGTTEEDTDLDLIVNEAIASRGRRTTPSRASDEQTRNVLDLIGQAEGSGYDTLFGYSESRYGVKPTAMTISEVQDLQKRMGRELGSSAAGKYQIMQDTLRDAIRAMNLTGNEMFDEEMQDRIATEFLLPRRGYDRFRRGELSSRAFLRNLSQEWASIPTAVGGQSFYAGDRMGNKASRGGQQIARLISGS